MFEKKAATRMRCLQEVPRPPGSGNSLQALEKNWSRMNEKKKMNRTCVCLIEWWSNTWICLICLNLIDARLSITCAFDFIQPGKKHVMKINLWKIPIGIKEFNKIVINNKLGIKFSVAAEFSKFRTNGTTNSGRKHKNCCDKRDGAMWRVVYSVLLVIR